MRPLFLAKFGLQGILLDKGKGISNSIRQIDSQQFRLSDTYRTREKQKLKFTKSYTISK